MHKYNQFFGCLVQALKKRKKIISIPYFPLGWSILKICLEENYLINLQRKDNKMIAFLAHNSHMLSLHKVQRYSLPSCRQYFSFASLINKKEHFNTIYVLSTSMGIISHHGAIKNKVGGELLCSFEIK